MGDNREIAYPILMKKFRERRNESEILLPLMSQLGESFDPFKNVQSCLSIGPGPGGFDLEFMQRCLPNLKKVVAVDKDPHCVEEIKSNLAKVRDGTLDCKIIQTNVNSFHPDEDLKFDIVLNFHMLYHFNAEDRRKLIKTILDEWIDRERGFLVIIVSSDELDEEQQPTSVMQNICRRLSLNGYGTVNAGDIRKEVEDFGGEVVRAEKYKCDVDFRVFGEDVTQMFNSISSSPIDSETVRRAVEESAPSGIGTYVVEVLIIQKKKKNKEIP